MLSACGLFNPPPAPPTKLNGHGLTAEYYSQDEAEQTRITRDDPTINFQWNARSPLGPASKTPLSARWLGFIQPVHSDTYTFIFTTSGQASLWIDGKEVIADGQMSGAISLQGNHRHSIEVRYDQRTSTNDLRLEWQSSRQARQVIPTTALFPNHTSRLDRSSARVGLQDVQLNQNLLVNADFEATGGWTANSGSMQTSMPGRDGTGRAAAVPRYNALSTFLSPAVLEQGTTYTVDVWAKAPTGGACAVRIEVSDGPVIKRTILSFTADSWQKQSFTADHAYSAERLFIRLGSDTNGKGACAYDDISAVAVNRPAAHPTPARNTLPDGGFEKGGTGWTLATGAPLTFTTPGQSGTGSALDLTATPNDPYGLSADYSVPATQLKANTEYVFTFWGSGNCSAMIRDPNQVTGAFATGWYTFSGPSWQQKRLLLKTPATVENFVLNLSSAETGSCKFDDVAFGPVIDDTPPRDPLPSTNPVSIPQPIATVGGSTAFDATSLDADAFTWQFSDGSTASGAYVEHKFSTVGRHSATLTVSRTGGETQTYTSEVAVLPEPQHLVTKRATTNTMTVSFDAGDPVPGLEYTYDFGDGTTGNGSRISHTYDKIGTYDYTLTIRRPVVTGQSLRAQTLADGVVYKQSSWHTIWQKAPQAKFTMSGITSPIAVGKMGATVSFNAQGSRDTNVPESQLTYLWDFGDRSTGEGLNVTHTYPNMGRYVVTLTVKNAYGLVDQYRDIVHIRDPMANLIINVDHAATLSSTSLPSAANQPARLQAQEEFKSTREYYPYVLPALSRIKGMSFRPLSPTGTRVNSYCSELEVYINGLPVSTSKVDAGFGTDPSTGGPLLCSSATFTSSTGFPLKDQPIGSAHGTSSKYLDDVWFSTFSKLAVPRVVVGIFPDEYISGDTASPAVKEFRAPVAGSTTAQDWLMLVNIRESEVDAAGTLKVKIPVLALDAEGALRTNATGRFKAAFGDTSLQSDCGDCTMVGGRAYITVTIPMSAYAFGQSTLDLGRIILMTDSAAGSCGNIDVSNLRLNGCSTVTTTTAFPTANAPETPPHPYPIATRILNHVFWGQEGVEYKKALMVYTGVASALAKSMTEYYAPYLLAAEHREDLNKAAAALADDGKITPVEYGKLVLANIGYLGSFMPQAVAPPKWLSIHNASVKGLGTTGQALDVVTGIDRTRSITVTQSADLIKEYGEKYFKIVDTCIDRCVYYSDTALDNLVSQGKTIEQAVQSSEAILIRAESLGRNLEERLQSIAKFGSCDLLSGQRLEAIPITRGKRS